MEDRSARCARRARVAGGEDRGSSYACRNLYNLPNERRSQHAYANAIDLPVFFLADGRKVDLTQGWGPTRRDLVAGVKLVPIVSKTPEGAAGGVTTVDMKSPANGASTMTVVKASAEQPADGAAAAPTPKAAPLPDPLAAPEAKFLRRVHRGACDVFSTVLGPETNDVHRTHLHLDLQDSHRAQGLPVRRPLKRGLVRRRDGLSADPDRIAVGDAGDDGIAAALEQRRHAFERGKVVVLAQRIVWIARATRHISARGSGCRTTPRSAGCRPRVEHVGEIGAKIIDGAGGKQRVDGFQEMKLLLDVAEHHLAASDIETALLPGCLETLGLLWPFRPRSADRARSTQCRLE